MYKYHETHDDGSEIKEEITIFGLTIRPSIVNSHCRSVDLFKVSPPVHSIHVVLLYKTCQLLCRRYPSTLDAIRSRLWGSFRRQWVLKKYPFWDQKITQTERINGRLQGKVITMKWRFQGGKLILLNGNCSSVRVRRRISVDTAL